MLDNKLKYEVGVMLKALRNESHMSLNGVSALTGITPNELDQIERGIMSDDFIDNKLIDLCDVYQIDTDYFEDIYLKSKRTK